MEIIISEIKKSMELPAPWAIARIKTILEIIEGKELSNSMINFFSLKKFKERIKKL